MAIAAAELMSTWAASAAHDRITAVVTTPAPKIRIANSGGR